MADSPLVYTSGRRRKTAHCSESLLHNAKAEEEESGIPVTTGTALNGSCPHVMFTTVEFIAEEDENSLPPSATRSKWKEGLESTQGPGS